MVIFAHYLKFTLPNQSILPAARSSNLSMLDTNKIQNIATSYSPQELLGALVWQRRFNEFDGEEVIIDLSNHSDLWHSFLFAKAIYAPTDEGGLSFANLVTTLLALANYRPLPETSMTRFIPYPADTLYVLTENQETLVTQLLDLGKKWRADSVEVIDRHNKEYGYYTQSRLRESLANKEKSLLNQSNLERLDAVVVTYWWD